MGIGYVSLSTDFEGNNLRALNYEGVEPTIENTDSGEYALARPFAYTLRAAGTYESEEKEALIVAFIDYLMNSKEGKETILANGGIANPENGTAWEELKANHPIVDQDNSAITIVTVGSTSVEKVINAALEEFQGLAGGFQFQMNQTGSGDGWKRTLGEEADGPNKGDIGFASRNFKDEEATDAAISSGVFCQDAIVVVVSADSPVTMTGMTNQQIFDIFTGAVADWAEVK